MVAYYAQVAADRPAPPHHCSSGSHHSSANALGPSVTEPWRVKRRACSTGTRWISISPRRERGRMLRGLAVGAQGDAGCEMDISCLAGDVVGGVELADAAQVSVSSGDPFQEFAAGDFLRLDQSQRTSGSRLVQSWWEAAAGHPIAAVVNGLVDALKQVASLCQLLLYFENWGGARTDEATRKVMPVVAQVEVFQLPRCRARRDRNPRRWARPGCRFPGPRVRA